MIDALIKISNPHLLLNVLATTNRVHLKWIIAGVLEVSCLIHQIDIAKDFPMKRISQDHQVGAKWMKIVLAPAQPMNASIMNTWNQDILMTV
jgi:hypothetical protein